MGQVSDGELHEAARQNDVETLQRLISAGQDVNIRDTVSNRSTFKANKCTKISRGCCEL